MDNPGRNVQSTFTATGSMELWSRDGTRVASQTPKVVSRKWSDPTIVEFDVDFFSLCGVD